MGKTGDIIVFVGIGLFLGGVWYQTYVKPHDAYVERVMECMGDSMDREIYDHCVETIKRG